MVNPFAAMYGNSSQIPSSLQNISTYNQSLEQENKQMESNSAANVGIGTVGQQPNQQYNQFAQQPQYNPYMQSYGRQQPYSPYMQSPQQYNPYMQQQQNPYMGLFGGGGYSPFQNQYQSMSQYRMPFQQQQNPYSMYSGMNQYQSYQPQYQQRSPFMFGTSMQSPIMQAPWFRQQRAPLQQGQYGYGNGIV